MANLVIDNQEELKNRFLVVYMDAKKPLQFSTEPHSKLWFTYEQMESVFSKKDRKKFDRAFDQFSRPAQGNFILNGMDNTYKVQN